MKKPSQFEIVCIILVIAAFVFLFGRSILREEKVTFMPQEPKPPFPYLQEYITFENPRAKIKLAGTLTLPAGEGNFPAVILISGGGPSDRNVESMGHKPFLVIADHLTRNGIAVLRFDDRGVKLSQGDYLSATSADFADDVESAIGYLKTRKEINSRQIGLAGHSEGGLIAPIVAARSQDVAFVIMLAGPGIPGDSSILLQMAVLQRVRKYPEGQIQHAQAVFGGVLNIVKHSSDRTILRERLKQYINANLDSLAAFTSDSASLAQARTTVIKNFSSVWTQFLVKWNPAPTLEKVTCPILALIGEKDYQVPAREHFSGIRRAAQKSGNKNVKLVELPNLNHLFQNSKTGGPEEYYKTAETFSPVALAEMTNWILQTTH
ncbi:alpha/beta hydrolase family protein [Dyadobacter pollutisoli]|uniref:Alpha/beta fold hydrolase n=1 Tax=Dyadobacter pollutisoli TaxID=2910158 RepID=A0A9E8SLR6_9BACT|nr:alpha/beta fold hydrolase [Dyadobacter pollutisoli]WAC12494.1 alpha/beta fold hydrolase [Dyadobacter pollutisoli]